MRTEDNFNSKTGETLCVLRACIAFAPVLTVLAKIKKVLTVLAKIKFKKVLTRRRPIKSCRTPLNPKFMALAYDRNTRLLVFPKQRQQKRSKFNPPHLNSELKYSSFQDSFWASVVQY